MPAANGLAFAKLTNLKDADDGKYRENDQWVIDTLFGQDDASG